MSTCHISRWTLINIMCFTDNNSLILQKYYTYILLQIIIKMKKMSPLTLKSNTRYLHMPRYLARTNLTTIAMIELCFFHNKLMYCLIFLLR